MHPALAAIRNATRGTSFEHDLWLVGGAVRDELLGTSEKNDFDLVTRGSSADLARLLWNARVSSIPPVTYERFGTAMVIVGDANVEIVTARKESYAENSRKPTVEPATLEEDALRRDFTVNTLMRSLDTWEILDPLGQGVADLQSQVLRTPLDPVETFHDDPLRMLRAVRFKHKLGFRPVPELWQGIRTCRERLRIVSGERIRDEWVKMLQHPTAPDAMQDLLDLGLLEMFLPEFIPMVGCEQGRWHHLDVWEHTLLVLRNAGSDDLILSLGALFHDVAKPQTRTTDDEGQTRFFGHESVGADVTESALRRLKFPQRDIDPVVSLVKNHMRMSSFTHFTDSAARRLVRDLGDELDRLLRLVEADADALKPGVKTLHLEPIRDKLHKVASETPRETLQSPLTGAEIMQIAGIAPGPEVGRLKEMLTEQVLEGNLAPHDREAAIELLKGAIQ